MSAAGRGSDQFALRLPNGMRDEIKAAAEANGRSMNAEIIARLCAGYAKPDYTAARVARLEAWAWGNTVPDRLPSIEEFAAREEGGGE